MASPLAMALLQAQGGSNTPPANIAQVAPTNYTQANSDYNSAMEQSYQAQLQQQNAFWGGLAGLGSAGILAGPKLLGSSAAGAGANPLAYGSAIPGAIGPTSVGGAPLVGTAAQFATGAADAGPVAAADAGADAVADAGATAAAGGGSDILATLASLFAFA